MEEGWGGGRAEEQLIFSSVGGLRSPGATPGLRSASLFIALDVATREGVWQTLS